MKRSAQLIHQIAFEVLNWHLNLECPCAACQLERDEAYEDAFKDEEGNQ
jgi:hypothetical protein